MCDQTEIQYLDSEVVWVKLGSCWWPGEVVGPEKLPSDLLSSFRKPPIAVVKFFQEDTYEYVKNINSIYKYNCSRKDEFIKKGLDMYRSKHGHMEKFPEDIIRAENATGGDEEILTRNQFQEAKKESYAGIFGDTSKKTPGSGKKGRISKTKQTESLSVITPQRKISKGNSDYKVHILVQGSKSTVQPSELSTPSTSRAGSEPAEDKSETKDNVDKPVTSVTSTPVASISGVYACHACNFSTSRLNVMILHNKSHSVTFSSYTPSPVRKKPLLKATPKSTPNMSKTSPKARLPRKEKSEKETKNPKSQKRPAEEESAVETKKTKTDEEIKSSLLADWDDGDEESNDESSVAAMPASPKIPAAAESPAVPVPAHLTSAPLSADTTSAIDKRPDDSETEKLDVEDDSNKYDFCEDEPDWPETADVGRKIPRVNNPAQRKEDTKSLSMDEDDVAKEVAELLSKTTVPDLPSAPESMKFEENFPEPSIVKSPDKQLEKVPDVNKSPEKITDKPPTKSIFKTKTFFRSRHSRSQDAIGKYVAEQLNAVERMNTSDCDMNGSEVASSPEARDSPPCETVKVTRLAPKIQLKKLKAQLAESEKNNSELIASVLASAHDITSISSPSIHTEIQQDHLKEIVQEPVAETTSDKIKDIENPVNSIEPTDLKLESKENTIVQETTNSHLSIIPVQDVPSEIMKTPDLNINTVIDVLTESNTDEVVSLQNNKVQNQSAEKVIVPEVEIETPKLFMNESTASAVDALLSVSREADRVTKTISNDPPEDLFEDDKVENIPTESLNGLAEGVVNNGIEEPDVEEQIVTTTTEEVNDTDLPIEYRPNGQNQQIANNIDAQMEIDYDPPGNVEEVTTESVNESVPSESDLQIAEALINLPSTALKNQVTTDLDVKVQPMSFESQEPEHELISGASLLKNNTKFDTDLPPQHKKLLNDLSVSEPSHLLEEDLQSRFETDQEKSENLNAAQSLVQMSEAFDHKMKNKETKTTINDTVTISSQPLSKGSTSVESSTVEQKLALLSEANKNEPNIATTKYETTSSKLLKMLEEPCAPKVMAHKLLSTKQIVTTVQTKDKILNLDVSNAPLKSKPLTSPKQKIIIRRTAPTKTLINNISEVSKSEKIVLSRTQKTSTDSPALQTYTIQASPDTPKDNNTIIIQPKLRKVVNTPSKLQKIKPQTSLVAITSDPKNIQTTTTDDALFDINSMPIVLSDDILTPENIEKMPIVMSDGNIITNPVTLTSPSKHVKPAVKPKQTIVEAEKISITAATNKAELKTLLINPTGSKPNENKASTPNILSKSTKLRAPKPMLVIDKATGKQKIIMTKAEPTKTVKEISQTSSKVQNIGPLTGKCEKFIILPTNNAPRAGRTQKIVIDPHSGKAHVLVGKSSESTLCLPENKPVSAKLVPAAPAVGEPVSGGSGGGGGGTVMIITNAQGTQSRIVLTPEHEKLLFPNKQQANLTQIKTIAQRQVPQTITAAASLKPHSTLSPVAKPPARTVSKQKSAIITSKGQLIVGGRIATTVQNITPLTVTEPKPVPSKRIVSAEPKKIIQTVQKSTPEPLIFLQQKSGAVMQLTAAQFEHLQKTGQIVQKNPSPVVQPVKENKIIVQKSVTITSNESVVLPLIQKQQRVRASRAALASPSPAKKLKKEITLAPAPPSMPPLAPISQTASPSTVVSNPANNTTITTNCNAFQDLENFEELLPSTAIARQPEQTPPTVASPCQPAAPALAPAPSLAPAPDPQPPLTDGQLLAVPGENFGGPPGSFYLCVEDNGTLTPIDNRPLVLENNQLVPMAVEPAPQPQPERRDILEAALANSDVFHADPSPPSLPPPALLADETHDFRDLNSNVPVLCRVSETSTTLNQPIMTPVEVPSKCDTEPTIVPSNLEDGLAVIGVTPHTVPTSLELPITVTDPRIALKAADALNAVHYDTGLLPSPGAGGEISYVSSEETIQCGPISMPLLTEEEDGVGKSMPILTDEILERTASSVESASHSPSLPEPGEGEGEGAAEADAETGGWSRRLLTPGSDSSDTSAEIPLQPAIQISVNDITHTS